MIDHDYAVGIGRVKAGDFFSFELMPAAGSTFPLGVVLAPAFVKAAGALRYRGGSVKSTPDPKIIPLVPK